jgi:hypothetical protein
MKEIIFLFFFTMNMQIFYNLLTLNKYQKKE